jgi:chromosome segregation ATPase
MSIDSSTFEGWFDPNFLKPADTLVENITFSVNTDGMSTPTAVQVKLEAASERINTAVQALASAKRELQEAFSINARVAAVQSDDRDDLEALLKSEKARNDDLERLLATNAATNIRLHTELSELQAAHARLERSLVFQVLRWIESRIDWVGIRKTPK